MFGIAILLAVALGAVASTALIAKQGVDELLTPKSAEVVKAQKQLEAPLPGKAANVLIMGSDYRTGFASTDKRSDTLLLVRLDPQGKSISMLSFPRDLYVDIPGHGQAKINDAFTLGGPDLTVQTVKEITGLDVHFISVVDFRGFRGIIDALGGVFVDVDRRYLNETGNYAKIDIQPGYQLLGGRDALAYARYRHTDSDFHRIARQQMLLSAMKKQISASKVAGHLPGLFRVLHKNSDMATGGNGKISSRQVIDYMRLAVKLRGRSIYQVDMQGSIGVAGNGASIVTIDETTMQGAVNAFLNPDEQAQEESADQVTGIKSEAGPATGALPAPARVQVEVRNGNGVDGSAGTAAVKLRGLGYNVLLADGPAGNADNQNYANTRVQYKGDRDQALAASIALSFPGATAEKVTAANPTRARILVIVGRQIANGDDGDAAPGVTAKSNKVPEKVPARVVVDPEYGREDVQALLGSVKMPILYPVTRETNSTYDSNDGVRGYQIAKGQSVYQAYRLVLKTGSGDYWGIQGTTWPDPPILDDPTREVTRAGRSYQLYFNGTRLHMVAWRQGGAVYWVTNSVLDQLGNETMLAVAQGARRVRR